MKAPSLIKFQCKIRVKSGVIIDHLSMPAMSRDQAISNLKKIYYKCEILEVIEPKINEIETVDYNEVLDLIVND